MCRDSAGQHSLPYKLTGRMMLLYISPLSLGGIPRSQTTPVIPFGPGSAYPAMDIVIDAYGLVHNGSKKPELFRLNG